ncbi:MAG: methyl-accepting chemotaxis protein, partial [Pseudomonadales bacterium]|nr:methyl-accepting chemotaxis protein [Pseudomonadales bacterium]
GTCVDDFHANPAHQRGMLDGLKDTYETDLDLAGLTFGLIATPVFDNAGNRSGTVVEWNDKTEAIAAQLIADTTAAENARVKMALDNVGTATMITDVDLNVIYTNNSAITMMRNAEADIRTDLPNFEAAAIIGSNIDIYHKNPSHQRNLVGGLRGTFKSELKVGGRTMSIVANSIELEGERIGTVVEWNDRTMEVAIEEEINNLVTAANAGDFTIQLSEDGKEGFFQNLTLGLNSLTATAHAGLSDVLRVVSTLAEGDLTNKIDGDYAGIFASLKDGVNGTVDKLTEVIGNIRVASTTLRNGASEIATGNADLSQRTEEQASALEETASSMEEMTSVVKQGADNAKDANDLAQSASKKASEGGEIVQNAIVAMEAINKSSKEIADIIGVIEEIAFQTNLLALNAAVEAARAGEQGRGFAVVAAEVRNLAQRSADASKDIKDLIRDSETKVSEGSNLVNQSGTTLGDIEEAVVKVSSMIADITAGTQEQTSGIEQVNTAISQMDEMTQQNAALVEEASASSEAVSEQAIGLSKMMEFFTVNNSAAIMSAGAGMGMATAPASAPIMSPNLSAQGGGHSSDDSWEDF